MIAKIISVKECNDFDIINVMPNIEIKKGYIWKGIAGVTCLIIGILTCLIIGILLRGIVSILFFIVGIVMVIVSTSDYEKNFGNWPFEKIRIQKDNAFSTGDIIDIKVEGPEIIIKPAEGQTIINLAKEE